MTSSKPNVIDLTGLDGPFALLKVSQIFRKMRAGDVLEILGCEPDIRSDMLRVLPAPAFRLLESESGVESGRVLLQKRKTLHRSERMVP